MSWEVLTYIEEHRSECIDTLRECVALPSVSAWVSHRSHMVAMANWLGERLTKLGFTVELRSTSSSLPSGELPPAILASLGRDPTKCTVLCYGHYDVMPADETGEGWGSDPWTLTEKDGKLYGRGASDNKGPLVAWLHAIEAFQQTGAEIPVNLRFLIDGMEEQTSLGLRDLVETMAIEEDEFLANIDYVCLSDSSWLGKTKPCLAFGLRGVIHFWFEVQCADSDLHSGAYGGVVYEAIPDLVYILNRLVDKDGNLLIPGVSDEVSELVDSEVALYERIDFDVEEKAKELGCSKLRKETKQEALMSIWRYPSLSIHGIEGAFSSYGFKSVIPSSVVGKVSLRIVPNMTIDRTTGLVLKYVEDLWKQRGSPNTLRAKSPGAAAWWMVDMKDQNFSAAVRATQRVHGVEPDMVREGGSIPITLLLSQVTRKSVILLPICGPDDGAHAENEKMDIDKLIQGSKVLAVYLSEIGKAKPQ